MGVGISAIHNNGSSDRDSNGSTVHANASVGAPARATRVSRGGAARRGNMRLKRADLEGKQQPPIHGVSCPKQESLVDCWVRVLLLGFKSGGRDTGVHGWLVGWHSAGWAEIGRAHV